MDRLAWRCNCSSASSRPAASPRPSADLDITQPTATKHVARAGAAPRRAAAEPQHARRRASPRSARCTTSKLQGDRRARSRRPTTSAALLQSSVGGTLRIGTSVAFGRRVLTPLVLRFMQRAPGPDDRPVGFEDRYVDLVEQGIDVAIRMGRLADSSLGARYLGLQPVGDGGRARLPETARARRSGRAIWPSTTCLIYSTVQGDDPWHFTDLRKGGRDRCA
ncbi:MAG: LysR substrate-binding domain-containing protein [Rhodopseudomonas palustris]|nr:LysR substrate-binding domain-containing protein [Rhodopseudomonas palustris]